MSIHRAGNQLHQCFENIELQFLEVVFRFHMKSAGFHEIHPKPYKIRCFNKNYSVWWVQERGYDLGSHEIWGHSPPPCTPPNWRVFVETSDFVRFGVDFTWNPPDFTWNPPDFMDFMVKSTRFHVEIRQISWNPPDFTDFMNVSFWVMIKYRSFYRKAKHG